MKNQNERYEDQQEEEEFDVEGEVIGDVWFIEPDPDEWVMDPDKYAFMRFHEAALYSGYYDRQSD